MKKFIYIYENFNDVCCFVLYPVFYWEMEKWWVEGERQHLLWSDIFSCSNKAGTVSHLLRIGQAVRIELVNNGLAC